MRLSRKKAMRSLGDFVRKWAHGNKKRVCEGDIHRKTVISRFTSGGFVLI